MCDLVFAGNQVGMVDYERRSWNRALQTGWHVNHVLKGMLSSYLSSYKMCLGINESQTQGPFLEGPEKFSLPESHNKNLKP